MADDSRRNRNVNEAAADADARYTAANPRSRARYEQATQSMPGGNTRSVLFYSPFPLTWVSGEGATLADLDGHAYTDFLGEFTAGLYGHSNPVIRAALQGALEAGIGLGGPNRYEAELAAEVCKRFPSIELVRFCNSGTEANLLALSAARAITGRDKVMVFDGAYHGSVFTFGHGGSPLNVPFPFVTASFNDTEGTLALIERHASDLAAIIIEPMMGSGGGIAAEREFLSALRAAADRHGIVLVFDEVMTSRLSPSGLQGATGVIPDMTTLGKYLGGGASFGAFGGRRRLMERFDPRRPDAFGHHGTFNNNVLSMAAGLAGLTQLFTPEAAVKLNARGDRLREDINRVAAKHGVAFQATGLGSILALHFHAGRIRRPADAEPHDPAGAARMADLQRLFHLEMIERGFFLARRGFISLALPITEADCAAFTAAIDDFLSVQGGAVAEGAA